MNRLLHIIRRHPRLCAGSAVILLAGTALFVLHSTGSAHAAAGSAHAQAGTANAATWSSAVASA